MLNEQALSTYERLPTVMLYKLPCESYFEFSGTAYFFDHVDGMYSVCRDLVDLSILHCGASTPVVPLKAPTV